MPVPLDDLEIGTQTTEFAELTTNLLGETFFFIRG